jgi:hypothetical protein
VRGLGTGGGVIIVTPLLGYWRARRRYRKLAAQEAEDRYRGDYGDVYVRPTHTIPHDEAPPMGGLLREGDE